MSHLRANEEGTDGRRGVSISEAAEGVGERGLAQLEALQENQRALSSLQAALSAVERRGEAAQQELRCKERELLVLEGEMEHLEWQIQALRDRCASASKEITELQADVSEEEEQAAVALAGFSTYRAKMEGHRAAALRAASQTEARKEVEEKRTLVRMLTQKKEELKEDLENPNGNTAQMAKREIDALKREISVMTKTTAVKKEQLKKEFDTHAELKKDIEIQNRRHEAIIKRLHCQLSRTHAVRRQMTKDIYQMERELAELKMKLETSVDR